MSGICASCLDFDVSDIVKSDKKLKQNTKTDFSGTTLARFPCDISHVTFSVDSRVQNGDLLRYLLSVIGWKRSVKKAPEL